MCEEPTREIKESFIIRQMEIVCCVRAALSDMGHTNLAAELSIVIAHFDDERSKS